MAMNDGQLGDLPEPVEASRRALASVDTLVAADPARLTDETRRLRTFMRVRRIAYYSVLLPFGLLSRVSPLLVLLSAAVALVAAAVVLVFGRGAPLFLLMAYWAIGGFVYHTFSVRMVLLTEEAARSVGLSGPAVLAAWGGRAEVPEG